VMVDARKTRAPFGQWLGRFRERLSGAPDQRGNPGQITPMGRPPSTVSMLPHRVSIYKRASFWNPSINYKRQEYLVSPPDLPGTAIRYTLFHPVYIPGLQGWKGTLCTNYGWIQGMLQNFARWNMLAKIVNKPVSGRGRQMNVWKPVMRPQPYGNARVWNQPRPSYMPPIINLPKVK
jgi:hypothetical protein